MSAKRLFHGISGNAWIAFEIVVLGILFAHSLSQLAPGELFSDTLTVGGDTPAHNYLASHLKEQLFQNGRIVSWAPGWWAGFPAFQFYFFLPYLMTALLSLVLPFNIAFKLINVFGILMLPAAAYIASRLMRLPRPIPILMAIAMIPFLFVKSHTMWGANIYSTLAGMIANSLSFAIMLVTVGSWWRDAEDGKSRMRSVILAWLLVSSHFFTSVMAALVIVVIPLLLRPGVRVRAFKVLFQNGILVVLTTAWWTIPLIAKKPFSVSDFGVNWDVTLQGTLPHYLFYLLPLAVIALILAFRNHKGPVILLAWMLLASCALFWWGFELNNVFVNVRLWPFVFFALLALTACGLGLLVTSLRAKPLLIIAALATALLHTTLAQQDASTDSMRVLEWAEFNFGGLESRTGYDAFNRLVLPLKDSPGRLANDLAEENNAMGSSRIFECVPHVVGKPIIEGGIVNSGLSSYFAYYIQCETSSSCAGYPTLVNPTGFNLTAATTHLELFNVKHFIARWPQLQQSMLESPNWRLVDTHDAWQLFELTTHEGDYVTIPTHWPRALVTDNWKAYALDWMYTPDAIEQPFVFLSPGADTSDPILGTPLDEAQLRQFLARRRAPSGDIDEWLHLGPFPYHREMKNPLSQFNPIDEASIDPQEGDSQAGLTWRMIYSRNPIFPSRWYAVRDYFVAYSFVNVFSPTARDALIHYANDDGVRITLNGERLVEDRITGLGNFKSVPVRLEAGRNRIAHKTEEIEGGHFFHVRLTDPEGNPFPDVVLSTARTKHHSEPLETRHVQRQGRGVLSETVTATHIRFTTDAIGLPHLIKCTYYPNWKVTGAKAIHLVSPAFMLVYPEQPVVELSYGRTASDIIGICFTIAGWISVAAIGTISRNKRHDKRFS
jgi:hypothetical protein